MYQKFKEKLLTDFEIKRDVIVASKQYSMRESLFGIRNRDDKVYEQILLEFERITLNSTNELVLEIFKKHNITAYKSKEISSYCIAVETKEEKHYIVIINKPQSINSERMHMIIEKIRMENCPVTFVFLLKDTLENHNAMLQIERQFYVDTITEEKRSEFSCLLFTEFLLKFFGQAELDSFSEMLEEFNNDFHNVIGYQITELCTPKNLNILRSELNDELKSFNYDKIKQKPYVRSNNRSFSQSDFEKNFEKMRSMFIDNKRYELLLSNADFAKSFLTSEWLYKKYVTLDKLDNTFIVAGYLKSIEQLLWDIIVLTGVGRKIKDVKITTKEDDTIDKTLGALEWFIGSWYNSNLYLNSFVGDKNEVVDYLRAQIADWRANRRNGYFHKHELSHKKNVDLIREETWFLYFLILGSLKLSNDQVKKIAN